MRAAARVGALATLALHAAAVGAILSYEPARTALASVAPIMVSLVAPEPPRPVEIAPPKPKVQPKPRPRPVAKPPPPATPPPPVTVAETAPAPVVAPAPPPPPPPEPVVAAAPVAAPPPVTVTAPVFDAAYLKNPAPAYPTLSRRRGEQGRVVLRVRVNPQGTADDVQVRESSGHERLDAAASDCVRGWRFVPARRGEEPVAAWVLIPISFRLEG